MMKTIILFLLFSVSTTILLAQKRLEVYKTFGGIVFEYDSIDVSPRQVLNIMYMNSEAYREFKIARRYYTAAGICGSVGGAMLAVPIALSIAGGDPSWVVGTGGAVILLATIPFSISYRNRALNAVDIYNEQKKARVQPYFYFKGTGVGVGLRF